MKTIKEIKATEKSILIYNEKREIVLNENNVQTDELVFALLDNAEDSDVIEIFEDDEVLTVVLNTKKESNSNAKTIREIKKGDFFTLKEIAEPKESQVYIKGDYDKSTKTYSCYKFSDVNNERFLKGSKEIYTGFTF